MAISARIVFDRIPALEGLVRENASKIVRKSAFDLQARAQQNAHVLTGSMRASVYVATSPDVAQGADTYAQATAAASAANPRARIAPEASVPPSGISAVVGVGVLHGVFEEERAGHAFLLPAADTIRPEFEQAMRDVANG